MSRNGEREPTALSLSNTFAGTFVFQAGCFGRFPEVAFQVNAEFRDFDAFTFEKLFLKQGVWSTNQDFPVITDHAVPRDSFPGRRGGHGASGCARAARQAQSSSEGSIS